MSVTGAAGIFFGGEVAARAHVDVSSGYNPRRSSHSDDADEQEP